MNRKSSRIVVIMAVLLVPFLCWGQSTTPQAVVERARKAAEQNNAEAQNNLGLCYATGYGVPKDYTEAVKWFRKAAEQGYAEAQNRLGHCYSSGHGVTKDNTEAVKWFRKAADQGLADAQFSLGLSYGVGSGVSRDMVEAYKWLILAAANGNTDYVAVRDKHMQSMTPEQIADGQRRAAAFVRK